ncbi:MAG: hypothetical protein QW543_05155 [Sulfolobales archaeon]
MKVPPFLRVSQRVAASTVQLFVGRAIFFLMFLEKCLTGLGIRVRLGLGLIASETLLRLGGSTRGLLLAVLLLGC